MNAAWPFKHFSPEEVDGLEQKLVAMLDEARSLADFPFVISHNGGFRPPDVNAAAGGVPDSSHTRGEAADLKRPPDDFLTMKMCWALGRAGFDRVLIYTKHIHVDVDKSKPSPCVIWMGESK